ncbi:MAG: leucyl aminopeptidase [Alteromonadaceae bacterium]|uniref:leucyl aminopeptidase n=1 Tax=unclassified Marinobacter TaxID=83889 RepID=UPI000C571982|nr:leucyl aminopeptidase [Marinobacter sp. BGYM27]MAA66483.1 leucyl aminopeptidase [Alteromonadaceae bacterium]MBH86041.1 leucyl aminopeptidase [Alteromonadaceae bacterium]MDG5498830.1 leucyl aminopeptidase [Marinobacter sp. BGYM27]|tara:strand:+ start:2477 stop:3952 length:1476 start_codon:yes stop_codon:yes gene_type:complete
MKYALNSKPLAEVKADCLIVSVPEKGDWPASTAAADAALDGQIKDLQKAGDISGKAGSSLLLPLSGQPWNRLLLVGSGNGGAQSALAYRKMVTAALSKLTSSASKKALVALADNDVEDRDESWKVSLIARLSEELLYSFTGFKSTKASGSALASLTIAASANNAALKKAMATGEAIGHGMNFTRDLGNTPPNVCNPSWLADQAKQLAKTHDVIKTEILDEKQMKKLGMNSLLSVSAGSDQPARLIVMEYRGGKAKDKPHVLVGKGITFDSGGISLKPGEGMDEMKYDMGGAASVFGTMRALAEIKPAINVVAIVAAAENMPGGGATRPGDIVTSMSGQTIEILNTDAEGRLVLCDALTYAGKYDPESVVDIATLTGAIIVALGKEASGLFSNNEELALQLQQAGQRTCDRVWQLPIWEEYQPLLDSNFADMQNIGGRMAGSITAACFLSRFTRDYRWAHLDIAGTAWLSGKEKGSTGRPVPLLVDYLLSNV